MYYEYFGLNQPPFRITPDTSLFFPGGDRGAILEALVYAVLNNEGIVKVTGEVGSGKTMLCRMLEKELPDRVEVVYLANPSVSPENILHAIAFELKLPSQPGISRLQVMHQLQEYLLQRHGENRQVVVFVEEAQGMPIETLEEIRLLSNLETRQHKLLQIVLFGQPELDERIARKEIRQLKERITYSFRLNPFKSPDIREYLNSRLRSCGYRSVDVFEDGAVAALARYSGGLVRRINILADKSMLAAYADNTRQVGARHVERAAADSEFVPALYRYRRAALAGAVAAAIAVTVIIWAVLRPAAPEPDIAATPAPAQLPLAEPAAPVAAAPVPAPTENSIPAVEAPESAPAGETEIPEPLSPAEESPPVTAENPTTDSGLMDLSTVLELPERMDPRLTPEESEILQRQLVALPPEDAAPGHLSSEGDACKLCWSIIYRPLAKPENL